MMSIVQLVAIADFAFFMIISSVLSQEGQGCFIVVDPIVQEEILSNTVAGSSKVEHLGKMCALTKGNVNVTKVGIVLFTIGH